MFVDKMVTKQFDWEERYDKFSISSTLLDVSFKGASCSVIESQIIKSCDKCNLKYFCRKIDEMVKEYTERTTVVTNSFSFGG